MKTIFIAALILACVTTATAKSHYKLHLINLHKSSVYIAAKRNTQITEKPAAAAIAAPPTTVPALAEKTIITERERFRIWPSAKHPPVLMKRKISRFFKMRKAEKPPQLEVFTVKQPEKVVKSRTWEFLHDPIAWAYIAFALIYFLGLTLLVLDGFPAAISYVLLTVLCIVCLSMIRNLSFKGGDNNANTEIFFIVVGLLLVPCLVIGVTIAAFTYFQLPFLYLGLELAAIITIVGIIAESD